MVEFMRKKITNLRVENPKIQKSKNPKIQKSKNPKIFIYKFGNKRTTNKTVDLDLLEEID